MALPKIFRTNLVTVAGALLTPSSEEPGMTREALFRIGVTDAIQWLFGYDVRTGENDRIDFNRGGVKVATIAQAHYATFSAYATAVVAAMNAADAQAWSVTRSVTTGIVSFSAGVSFSLLFNTGANFARSAHRDLGFLDIDRASSALHVSNKASWQSRRSINLDAGLTATLDEFVITSGFNDKLDVGSYRAGITSSSVANPTTITTSSPHNLTNGDRVRISDHTGSTPDINGSWIATVTGASTFTIPVNVTVGGSNGAVYKHISITIPADTYSGSTLAAKAAELLATADPTMGWMVEFGSNIFGFATPGLTPHVLLTGTGVNVATSTWGTMGFFTGSDSTAFTSHSSDFEVSGSALPNANFGYILGHDLSEQGTAKLQGSASTLVGVGLLATTPSLNVTLDPDPSERSDIRLKEFNQVGFRFWRLILEDVQNDAGFLSLGKWFVGNGQFLTGIAMGVSDTRDELTTIAYAVEGAHSAVDRETRRVLSVTIHRITDADKLVLESFAKEVKIGGPFLFVQDSNDIYSGRYVFMNEGFSFETVEDSRPVLWEASVSLLEVIG